MRYVALLRGINVSGKNMIKMDALRATCESLRFANVVSYINSGNVAFDLVQKPAGTKGARESESHLVTTIENAIERDFGFRPPVMLREQATISNVLANDPFKGEYESHKQMHVLFMRDEMPADTQAELAEHQTAREKFAVIDREIYALLLDGVAESNVFKKNIIEGRLKTPITGRNWRTVEKLTAL